jgi:hypothetical protein
MGAVGKQAVGHLTCTPVLLECMVSLMVPELETSFRSRGPGSKALREHCNSNFTFSAARTNLVVIDMST